ncbi:MAG: Hsp33 family molecular chaperone HslO [Oscillospiraceae bacterium]|nr:Hsp33 family molecular chaperone HslO [Oscillospiraceae bacterium]
MKGKLKRYLSGDGAVVCAVLEGTEMCREMERIHKTSAVCTAALGRLSMAASLIGYTLKEPGDTVTVRLDGGGPAGILLAVADDLGNVKSYAENKLVELPLNAKGKLDVAGAVGTDGTIFVIKDIGMKEPYSGQTALVSGEIAEDVTQYFAESEQIPSACGLGVLVDPDLTVNCAGGYLIQLLPFAPESDIVQLEANLKDVTSVTDLLRAGMTADDIAKKLLAGLNPELLDESEPAYACDCSRERTERMLRALDVQTLRDMADEMPEIEVCCHFCTNKYVFTPEEVRRMAEDKERLAAEKTAGNES